MGRRTYKNSYKTILNNKRTSWGITVRFQVILQSYKNKNSTALVYKQTK